MDEQEPTYVVSVSSARVLLAGAAELVELADRREAHVGVLVGCTVVVLAAALDQATKGNLDFLLQAAPYIKEIDIAAVEALREDTLSKRVLELPEVWSGHRVRMDTGHADVRCLLQLIRLRNALVHPRDTVMTTTALPVLEEDDESQTVEVAIVGNRTPWSMSNADEGKRYLRAVTAYFTQVIEREPTKLEPGGLLIPARRH